MSVVLAASGCCAQSKSPGHEAQACAIDSSAANGDVSGVVVDPTGARISSAVIRSICGANVFETQAGSDGHYSIDLPFGNYGATTSATGLAKVQQAAFRVNHAQETLDFNLSVQQSSSIVNVVAPAGYVGNSSTAATKTGTPLIERPQAVSVITLDEMQQRGVQTLSETLNYTAGVGVNTYGTETRFGWYQRL